MSNTLDLAIIGAGVSGLTMARYAKSAGLSALVFDKAEDVGGLWARLPSWQDIQFRALDWSINNLPMGGVLQPDIHHNIRAMVPRYGLEDMLRLGHAVTKTRWDGEVWTVDTDKGAFTARHLVVASGLHNSPRLPDLDVSEFTGQTLHSSNVHDPSILTDQSVTIVGGSASAFDLIDLALEHKAREIHWVYRDLRWMVPSTLDKHARSTHRTLALSQMLGSDIDGVNAATNQMLQSKYAYFKLEEIMPDYAFDIRQHSIVPGRPGLVQNFDALHRHPGQISRLEGKTAHIALKEGGTTSFETDLVLFGTGYQFDLDYLGLDKLSTVNTSADLRTQCCRLIASTDYPNLFFLGATLLDGNGTTPWATAVIARTIAKLIAKGEAASGPVIEDNVSHWNLLEVLAPMDRKHYPIGLWRAHYLTRALWYRWRDNEQVRI